MNCHGERRLSAIPFAAGNTRSPCRSVAHGSKIRQSDDAGLHLSSVGIRGGLSSPASVPASIKRGVGVGDRKAGEGMSANEPRRIARRREPMFNAPAVVLGLIAVLIGIYAAYNWAPEAIQDRIIRNYAFIPGRLTIAIWPDRLIDLLSRANTRSGRAAAGATDPGIACAGRRREAMDAADLRLSARILDPRAAQLRLAGRVRAADRPPVRLGEVSSVHGGDRNRQRARALGDLAHGFLPAHRRVGSGFRASWARRPASCFSPERRSAPFGSLGRPRSRDRSRPRALRDVFLERRSLIFIVIWFGTNFIFGAGAQTARLFGHAGRLGRPSRRLSRRTRCCFRCSIARSAPRR